MDPPRTVKSPPELATPSGPSISNALREQQGVKTHLDDSKSAIIFRVTK